MTTPLPRRARPIVVLTAGVALAISTVGLSGGGADASTAPGAVGAVTLPGSHPTWATAAADRGAVSGASPVSARIYLAGADPAGLAAYATAVSDPASSLYGKFLTPQQVQSSFGASTGQQATVRSWASAQGLTVAAATSAYVAVSGSAATIGKAFGTSLREFSTANGTLRAPATDLSVPQSISPDVLSVTGLTESSTGLRPASLKSPGSLASPTAPSTSPTTKVPVGHQPVCSAYAGQKVGTGVPAGYSKTTPYEQCPLVPSQLRTAYGVKASDLTGQGVTIAILDAYGSSTMPADANRYSTGHGDKAFRSGQYKQIVTPAKWNRESECGGPAGWLGEESLDIEMAHGLAPSANILYIGSNSCFEDDFLDSFDKVIDNHLADVISNSWGEALHSSDNSVDPGYLPAYDNAFERAAIEGISITFSTGDCGDDAPAAAATGGNCDPGSLRAQTEWPVSSPWVTAVGGTILNLASGSGAYKSQGTMGDRYSYLSDDRKSWSPFPGTFYFGGGGGTSEDFAQPFYQQGVVPNAVAHTLSTGAHSATARRTIPDVSMQGDLISSTLVGLTQDSLYSEGGYGGTSVSSPEFAAVLADVIQGRGGRALGLANPVLYDHAGSFRDVTAAHLSALEVDPTDPGDPLLVLLWKEAADYGLPATKGYDTATGMGTASAALISALTH